MSWGLTPIYEAFSPARQGFLGGSPLPRLPDRNPNVRLIKAAVVNKMQLVGQPDALADIRQGSWNSRLYFCRRHTVPAGLHPGRHAGFIQ
jgi:hypothetical protein